MKETKSMKEEYLKQGSFKYCKKCDTEKDISCFSKDNSKEDKLYYRCKTCDNNDKREYRKNNPDKAREDSLRNRVRRRYNITIEEYYKCMNTSDKCEICSNKDNLCYDHCHSTGEFRGVLCQQCNAAIGALGDDISGIKKALNYLKGVKND